MTLFDEKNDNIDNNADVSSSESEGIKAEETKAEEASSVGMVEDKSENGVSPLELVYFPVKTTARRERIAYHSELYVNNKVLGTITPSDYEMIANRNIQCVKLASWAFKKLVEDSDKMFDRFSTLQFVSMYVPSRMIMKDYLKKLLESAVENGFKNSSRICFEVSSNILLEDGNEVAKRINDLKFDFNSRFMLSTYGDAFCPIQRVEGVPFDYTLLDAEISDEDSLCKSSVQMAIKLANELKMPAVLNKKGGDSPVNKAFSVGCTMFIQDKSQTIDEILSI